MKIVLASSSKNRQDILNLIGLKYDVVTSDVPEDSDKISPDEYVKELSLNKANSVVCQIDYKAIIIAADEIIWCNGKKYEKPKSKEEVFNNLVQLSNNMNTAYTGITIIDMYKNKTITISSKTDVFFRKISDDDINWYIDNEKEIFNCCGYVPLGKASIFIDRIDGDYNTLFGLSPSIIFRLLKELGYNLEDFEFSK